MVVDAQHGTIYGMIVATSIGAQETYLMPAKDILDSLKAEWCTSDIRFATRNAGDEQRSFASTAAVPSPRNTKTVSAAVRKGKEGTQSTDPPINVDVIEYNYSEDNLEEFRDGNPPGARSVNHSAGDHKAQTTRSMQVGTVEGSKAKKGITCYYCCHCATGPQVLEIAPSCTVCDHRTCNGCSVREMPR